MSAEERLQRAGSDVVTLDQIMTWTEYFRKNNEELRKLNVDQYISKFNLIQYEFIPDLNKRVSIWQGDITKLHVDAIVNAANNSLLGGGGVDGAIHRAAGRSLLEECKTLKGCPTGEAKITGGYNLPAKYVIHSVGPQGAQPDLLGSCYSNSLKRLLENNLRTIAFPCISTGVYGYPQDEAACVALKCVRNFLERNPSEVDRIVFCLFLAEDVEIYSALMQIFFPIE